MLQLLLCHCSHQFYSMVLFLIKFAPFIIKGWKCFFKEKYFSHGTRQSYLDFTSYLSIASRLYKEKSQLIFSRTTFV